MAKIKPSFAANVQKPYKRKMENGKWKMTNLFSIFHFPLSVSQSFQNIGTSRIATIKTTIVRIVPILTKSINLYLPGV